MTLNLMNLFLTNASKKIMAVVRLDDLEFDDLWIKIYLKLFSFFPHPHNLMYI